MSRRSGTAWPPPYAPLFAWLEGRTPPPDAGAAPVFRPPMLAHPLEAPDFAGLDPSAYVAEWKWDGIRVQLVPRTQGGERIFSRGAEDVSAAFPDLAGVLPADAVLDGELLVVRDGVVAPFADLQQRLNRKTASAKMVRDFPLRASASTTSCSTAPRICARSRSPPDARGWRHGSRTTPARCWTFPN